MKTSKEIAEKARERTKNKMNVLKKHGIMFPVGFQRELKKE